MLQKYFRFSKKRIITFLGLLLLMIGLQLLLTGSILARQKVTTEAGNSESAVIGVLDKTELVRQKFRFDRKVILKEFALSFGSFEQDEVGENLNIQMLDGDNNIVYETTVPVDKITPNASYRVTMDYTVTIPKNATCCIKLSCSSKNREYDTLPTLNTTNRTDPNTYMSTLKMQTRKKCLNISYTYYYRQIFPMVVLVLEFALLFVLCFERVTEYGERLRKKQKKGTRQKEQARLLEEQAKARRANSKSKAAKVRYSRSNTMDERAVKKQQRLQRKKNKNQWQKGRKSFSVKDFVKWCLVEPKFIRRVRIAIAILNPLLVMFFIELMNENLLNMGPNVWIFTWLLLLAIQLFLFALTGNMSAAMLLLDVVLFPAGLANLVLMNVRGTPLLPSDLLALGTAAEVAGTYTISLTPAQFVMLPAFILWCFLIYRIRTHGSASGWQKRLVRRLTPVVLSVFVIGVLYNTPLLETCQITDNVWNKVASCKTNGFYMNFFINIHYLTVSKPSGYTQAKVEEILEEVKQDSTETVSADNASKKEFTTNQDYGTNQTLNGKQPNIILIMNESLADYDLIGETNYNRDPLKYLHSMKENTIYGKDYVSIYGAGTSNSEFEAMTGNTMKFFPSGCNVYQQFMHESTFSMAYYLKSLGYSTIAVHPSSGANWNRINTYNSMRFDRFVTIEEFKNPEYVRYISDKESYKKVIELYENKEEGKPLFAFDMTIQNHGGYLTNTKWDDPVYVKGSYYEETMEFLSATKVSDDAFKYLVEYFKKQEEPTIICMFGDHQPSIETEFYEELLKKKQSSWTLEDIQKRYVTPFVIWANYDIDEGQNAVISNNYLENLLLKQAGIELPLYNQYIEKVSQEIPVMNVNGYMDFSGSWHKYNTDETDTVKELLQNYEYLQYGYYSDMDKTTMCRLFQMKE
jgi:phosphoglycerol transferase MdoB-like AlkP superfamily enzyme